MAAPTNEAILEKWNNAPKDEVILHMYPRSSHMPTAALFPLKMETFLRLANIKYTTDFTNPMSSKGKAPWISLNGEHVSDTEFIIEHLNKKLGKDLNAGHDELSVAHAKITRVMLEEFFLWAIVLERFVYGNFERFRKSIGMPVTEEMYLSMRERFVKKAEEQGIGKHSQEEATHLMTKYLKSVSISLGKKKFFAGDDICQEDAGIFGILAQCVWGLVDSPYEKLLNGELKNLKDYCFRIKELAFPDWDELSKQ